jgi:hypothetical protein
MAPYPMARIRAHLLKAATGRTALQRGKALEQAVTAMFRSVPGVLKPITNAVDYANAGEIDLLIPNKPLSGLWFLPRAFLCECKCWKVQVGSQEIRVFTDRLRERACAAGILIATNGISGNASELTKAHRHISRALQEGFEILVLDWHDLRRVRSGNMFAKLLYSKWIHLKAFLTNE